MATEGKTYESNVAVTREHLSDDEKNHQNEQIEWTPEDEKRIRQRMDWRIVPVVLALYLMCFIDRWVLRNCWRRLSLVTILTLIQSQHWVREQLFPLDLVSWVHFYDSGCYAMSKANHGLLINRNARIQGLAKDLNLLGYKFNWALTVFYIGYIVCPYSFLFLVTKSSLRYRTLGEQQFPDFA